MAKTISVDELTYSTVVATAGKLMITFGRPFSLGLTIFMGTNALSNILNQLSPETIKKLTEMFQHWTPEDIEKFLDIGFRAMTQSQS